MTALSHVQGMNHERNVNVVLQGYLQNSPEALVFFDGRGTLLYQSAHGEALFNRWNRGLSADLGEASLPAVLRPAFQRRDGSLALQHPVVPGLSVALDPTPGGFVMRLLDEKTSTWTAELSPQALAALKKLTLAEQRTARLVVEGLRNEEIAARICRSARTIECQLHRVFRKLGVTNRVQLCRLLR